MEIKIPKLGLQVDPINSEKRKVWYNEREVGRIVTSDDGKRKFFKSIKLTEGSINTISDWINDVLSKRIKVETLKNGKYRLVLKTLYPEGDWSVERLVQMVYKARDIEELPF